MSRKSDVFSADCPDSHPAQPRAKVATFRKCVARGTPLFRRRVSARRQLPDKGRERALDPFALSAPLATVYADSWRWQNVSTFVPYENVLSMPVYVSYAGPTIFLLW